MTSFADGALGGYFELELPPAPNPLYPQALAYQSARAAFQALLTAGNPGRVWIPRFICDEMIAPLSATGIAYSFYDLNADIGVSQSVVLAPSDWLLYVNYFGICGRWVEELSRRFLPSQLVFDHSQAFFSPPGNGLATIYSPRKFFGVPDGGLLITTLSMPEPAEVESDSIARCAHLLTRLDKTPEAGYADFLKAEQSLRDTRPRKMSQLSHRLLRSIHHDAVKRQRSANFRFLHERLQHLNGLDIQATNIQGPLCYPLFADESGLRERLLAERIFVAQYWPEVIARVTGDSFESALVETCVAIPCDQRYTEADLGRVVNMLVK